MVHGLDTVGTHVTDSSNNMQSYILTCTKNLIQELHKHLSRSTFITQEVSHWLLPPLMHTMICNVAHPASTSKIFKSPNAVKFLIKPNFLSDQHFIEQVTTVTDLSQTYSADSGKVNLTHKY